MPSRSATVRAAERPGTAGTNSMASPAYTRAEGVVSLPLSRRVQGVALSPRKVIRCPSTVTTRLLPVRPKRSAEV